MGRQGDAERSRTPALVGGGTQRQRRQRQRGSLQRQKKERGTLGAVGVLDRGQRFAAVATACQRGGWQSRQGVGARARPSTSSSV